MNPKKKSSAWKWILFLLVVGGGGYGGWWYYQKNSKDTALDYRTAPVTRGEVIQTVTANGSINAVKTVTVGSQVSGIITDIKVDFNSVVTNGQLIAQIDPSTYQQNITQAEAELANSAAGLELTQLNFTRAKDLRAAQLISQADYDKALVDLHQAEAVVKTRNASLRKSQVDLERCTIFAPIDGIVISRVVDVGQTVAASLNAPTLFTIANDLHKMRIEALISEADVGGVLEGQKANFTVDAFPGRTFRGDVTQVRFAPITNQNVVNYTSVIEVNNADLKLRPGMTANTSIITAQKGDTLKIPNSALRFRPPEGALPKGSTNSAKAKGTNAVASVPKTNDAASGAPAGEGATPSREEMRQRMQNMTPEQREAMRARFGGGAGGRGGGGNRPDGPVTRTIYILTKETVNGKEKSTLKPIPIKVGISDGTSTEVVDGLKEGDVIVTGVNNPQPELNAARPGGGFGGGGGNPFGGGRGPGR
ncbi:MAG: hypothetical protein JWN25_1955 [Verrucomicrobiales bacterium]|nr:hypothetical protein [Verrucomicrobiales bacterium]